MLRLVNDLKLYNWMAWLNVRTHAKKLDGTFWRGGNQHLYFSLNSVDGADSFDVYTHRPDIVYLVWLMLRLGSQHPIAHWSRYR